MPTDAIPKWIGDSLGHVLWELFWIGVSLGITVWIAVRWGDALLEEAAKNRRLRAWNKVGSLARWRIRRILNDAEDEACSVGVIRFKVDERDVFRSGHFALWALQLRQILFRKGDSTSYIRLDHLRLENRDDRLIRNLWRLRPVMEQLHQQLIQVLLVFPDAIPDDLRHALGGAVLHLEEFDEHVKQGEAIDTIWPGVPLPFDPQMTVNCYYAAQAFEAIREVSLALSRALTPKQRYELQDPY